MEQILIPEKNSIWGVQVNPQSVNTYKNVYLFDSEKDKKAFVEKNLLNGKTLDNCFTQLPSKSFSRKNSIKASVKVDASIPYYANKDDDFFLNKDIVIIRKNNKDYYYAVLDCTKKNKDIFIYTLELDIFFTYSEFFNKKDDTGIFADIPVYIDRAHSNRYYKLDNKWIPKCFQNVLSEKIVFNDPLFSSEDAHNDLNLINNEKNLVDEKTDIKANFKEITAPTSDAFGVVVRKYDKDKGEYLNQFIPLSEAMNPAKARETLKEIVNIDWSVVYLSKELSGTTGSFSWTIPFKKDGDKPYMTCLMPYYKNKLWDAQVVKKPYTTSYDITIIQPAKQEVVPDNPKQFNPFIDKYDYWAPGIFDVYRNIELNTQESTGQENPAVIQNTPTQINHYPFKSYNGWYLVLEEYPDPDVSQVVYTPSQIMVVDINNLSGTKANDKWIDEYDYKLWDTSKEGESKFPVLQLKNHYENSPALLPLQQNKNIFTLNLLTDDIINNNLKWKPEYETKLLTYPYMCFNLYNAYMSHQFHPQFFSLSEIQGQENKIIASLNTTINISPQFSYSVNYPLQNRTLIYTPNSNYLKQNYNIYNISYKDNTPLSEITFISAYSNFITTQGNQFNVKKQQANFHYTTSWIDGALKVAGGAIGGFLTGGAEGAIAGGLLGGYSASKDVMNAEFQKKQLNAQIKDIKNTPPQVSPVSQNYESIQNLNSFYPRIQVQRLSELQQQQLGMYFHMYGYKYGFNSKLQDILKSRKDFVYIQTTRLFENITINLSNEIKNIINESFINGLHFWPVKYDSTTKKFEYNNINDFTTFNKELNL